MSNTDQNKARKASLSFAAIDPYIVENIVLPVEKNISSKNMVEWGTSNKYPDYLLDLYNNVPTLRSIINGNIDFVTGDDVTILPLAEGFADGRMNKKGETIREQVKNLAKDFETYGGFALQIIRNIMGEVAEVYYVDMRYLRTNKECNVFYYSEKWGEAGRKDCIVYPAYLPELDWARLSDEEKNRNASSILYVKNVHTQVYPTPLYAASVKACEIERCIDDYHLNSINNGFMASAIVNFNNGIPEDAIKEEIEYEFGEKFNGHQNGSRVMFSWNKNKESATTIDYPKIEDFGARYTALADHSRQQIFTAFRATPALFGIVEKTGFNNLEYEQAFKLYNRTQIQPVQRLIADTYDKVYGQHGVLTIKPFSIEGVTEDKVN